MSDTLEKEIARLVSALMTGGFNRSMNALEMAGAIDRKKMNKHYTGVGSKYYDLVTEQMNLTVAYAMPEIKKMVAAYEARTKAAER